MAQGSPTIASRLERDYRQDEFPIRDNSQQDESPTACHSPSPSVLQINHLDQLSIHEPPAKADESRICGFRKSVVWLGILAVVLFVLLVISGGVMGSLLAKNGSSKSEEKK